MARIFRHTYSGGRKSKAWYVTYRAYRDGTGEPYRKTVPGFTDKRATEHYAAKLEREAEQVKAGLLVPQIAELRRGLSVHLDEFEKSIRVGGASDEFAKRIRFYVQRVADAAECGWTELSDLNPDEALEAIAEIRVKDRGEIRPASAQLRKEIIEALQRFGRWCVPKRLAVNPFAEMSKPQVSADRRRVRRVITDVELRRLIEATRLRISLHSMPPIDRSMLYLLTAHCGFRAKEMWSLRVSDIDLDALSVTLDGKHTKNGQPARVPIPEWVADELRPWLSARTGQVWSVSDKVRQRWAQVLAKDLKAAGIPYRDESGRFFDFHSLRLYFASALARAGVGLQHAQKLMRHASPVMTANVYTQISHGELSEQVEKIKKAG